MATVDKERIFVDVASWNTSRARLAHTMRACQGDRV